MTGLKEDLTKKVEEGDVNGILKSTKRLISIASSLALGCSVSFLLGKHYQHKINRSPIRQAKIIDVNEDGKNDLYMGERLYIQTDKGFVPVGENLDGREVKRL